jgi:hypothetical protein
MYGVGDLAGLSENRTDPALRVLVEVWSELPDGARNRILRIADEALKMPVNSANTFQGQRQGG